MRQGFSCVLGRPISSRCRFSWRLYYTLIVNFRTQLSRMMAGDIHVFPFSWVDDQELLEHSSDSVQQNSNALEIITKLVHTQHRQTFDQSTAVLLRHLDNIYCNQHYSKQYYGLLDDVDPDANILQKHNDILFHSSNYYVESVK